MSLGDWVLLVFITGLVIATFNRTRLIWRHETAYWDRLPTWWIWNEGTFRALVRTMPVSWVVLAVADLEVLIWEISGDAEADKLVQFRVPLIILGLFVIGLLVLQVTIFFYSWPKSFVAPHLRSEPSLVEESRLRRARRR